LSEFGILLILIVCTM